MQVMCAQMLKHERCYASGPTEWYGEKREHVSTNPFVVAQAKGTIIRQALM